MALMSPQPKQEVAPLPAPEKSTNKKVFPIYKTQPVTQPGTGDTIQPYTGNLTGGNVGGLLSKTSQYEKTGNEPIYSGTYAGYPTGGRQDKPTSPLDTTNSTGVGAPAGGAAPAPTAPVNAPAGPTDGAGGMPPKPTGPVDGSAPNVPQSEFTPQGIETGDYTGVQSDQQLQYDPRAESLVQNQITGLLNPNSDIMRKAIAQSQGYAAQRGLQSSSIGGEMALSAMIDKALPIAQQDAQTYNQAQSQQWSEQAKIDAENLARQHSAAMADKEGTIQNSLQNNNLGWQTGEKNTDREFQAKMQELQHLQQLGTLDKQQELQLAQMERSSQLQNERDAILQTYQVELNQLQNDQRWKELTAQIGSQMEMQLRGFDQQARMEYGNAQATAINAAMQAIGMAMSNPNMTAEQQQEAVKQIMGSLQSQANQLAVIYGAAPLPNNGVAQPPGPATGISDPNPPTITPYPGSGSGGSGSGSGGSIGTPFPQMIR